MLQELLVIATDDEKLLALSTHRAKVIFVADMCTMDPRSHASR